MLTSSQDTGRYSETQMGTELVAVTVFAVGYYMQP